MNVSEKIKFWARIGQISYWVFLFVATAFEMQLPTYEPTIFSGTFAEGICVIAGITLAVLVSEAIVRVIGYFAELLEN